MRSVDWDEAYGSGDYLVHWDYAVPSQELVAAVAVLNLPEGSLALDLGCGAGREAVFLAEQGLRVYGIDFSAQALKIARKRASEAGVMARWICADVMSIPLPPESVDFVNDRGCFHVIPDNRRRKVAHELWRVMKPGARMLLRGSLRKGREGFIPITKDTLKRFFVRSQFSLGPIIPIRMIADTGSLRGNLVMLTRK